MKRILLAGLVAGLCLTASAHAQVPLVTKVSGNKLTATVQLLGGVRADLAIEFEQVVGLNPNALSLSAVLVNPLDLTLLSRLPLSGLSIPVAFPVLVSVDPTASSTLSFSGVYTISLYTHNLTLGANSPLRLYRAASPSGPFQDMTGFLELGSVRAGGSGPGFSQFLIVLDLRLIDPVIVAKFDALQAALDSNAGSIAPAALSDLQARLDSARSAYNAGSPVLAISRVILFSDRVKYWSGASIPDVWRANSSVVNVAGILRSGAETLRFSLVAKSNGSP